MDPRLSPLPLPLALPLRLRPARWAGLPEAELAADKDGPLPSERQNKAKKESRIVIK